MIELIVVKQEWVNVFIGVVCIAFIVAILLYDAARSRVVPSFSSSELLPEPSLPVEIKEWVYGVDYIYITNAFFVDGKYSGMWENKAPEGNGVFTVTRESEILSEGDVLKGVFRDGLLAREGILQKADGRVYSGAFLNGLPDGEGTMTWPEENGAFYEGAWKDGVMNGQGFMLYGNGEHYSGTWKNGKKSGPGRYAFANGDVYEGNFEDSNPSGIGTMLYADGGAYEGEFWQGLRSGAGEMAYADGTVYEGDFVRDIPQGNGKISWPGGNVYLGEFAGGERTGHGKIMWANGDVWEGQFECGQIVLNCGWADETEEMSLEDGRVWTDYPLLVHDALPNCVGFTLRFYLHPASGDIPDIGAKALNQNWRVFVYSEGAGWQEVGSVTPAAQDVWTEAWISFEPRTVRKVEVFPPPLDNGGAYRGSIELANLRHQS
ncbi:MAG: hypothetical protein LBT44_08300 [Clostridiales bacterium]|jgi:hypothetical protein|nr:hypothetical protein [Clostridiales bacterium]